MSRCPCPVLRVTSDERRATSDEMIVPMKKVFVVAQKKDAQKALVALRDVGIVHLEHEKIPAGQNLSELKDHIQMLEGSISILRQFSEKTPQTRAENWKDKIREISGYLGQLLQLKEQIAKREALIQQWEPWGDFEPSDVQFLSQRGVYIYFLKIPAKELYKMPQDVIAETVTSTKGTLRCAAIANRKVDVPFSPLVLPPLSLNKMKSLQQEDEENIQKIKKRLKDFCQYLVSFEEILKKEASEFRFQEALAGMGEAEDFVYLKGFCPVDNCEILERAARQEKWGLLMEDPAASDKVPTFLRHPRWVRLIEPVYNMMNILPGYRELDISPFFLVFFSIFFGMLVGDAGYGFLFLLFTLIAHWRLGKRIQDKTFLYLTYVLSTITIIWGLLTGTVFGTLLFRQVFKPILPWLTEIENVQLLCFCLGAIHLTISHVWRFINKIPKPMGMLSEAGWITLLWTSFFLARTLILGQSFPAVIGYMAAVAIIIIIADIVVQKQDMAVNLILLIFSIIGIFTDVVSYIRLFAVGLAGVSIADAFNQIALDIGFHNIFTAILASIILIFVHLFLNLILAILGVLVHGLRLNILEFSSHLNLEWSGIKYEPFRKLKEA